MHILRILRLYFPPLAFGHLLVLVEALLGLAIPYSIGMAVDDAIKHSFTASIYLLLVSISIALLGGFRRTYNVRVYGRIFRQLTTRQIDKNPTETTSKVSAHINLFQEFVEILRDDIPALFYQAISIIGTLIILVSMTVMTTLSAILCGGVIMLVYYIYRHKLAFYNQQYNEEYERQVEAINHPSRQVAVTRHMRKFVFWKIKIVDVNTLTYTIGWVILDLFMVLAIWHIVESGEVQQGMIVTLVMYVYQLTTSLAELPFFYVRFIRLREISKQTDKVVQ